MNTLYTDTVDITKSEYGCKIEFYQQGKEPETSQLIGSFGMSKAFYEALITRLTEGK